MQAERLLLTELTTLASVFVPPRSFINKIIMGKYFIFSAQTKLLTVRGANSGTKYVLCGIPGEEPVFTFGSLVHSLGGSKLGSFGPKIAFASTHQVVGWGLEKGRKFV